jgi:polyisoprenoid-binding protein YceI
MRAAAAGVLALLLAACHTPPAPMVQPTAAAAATPVPAAAHYAVDAGQSDVRLFVKRAGPMAALGHNHVLAVRQLQGDVYVADDPRQSHFELQFPVSAMSVDEPVMRAAAGPDYTSVVNDAARIGTRNNMLGERLLQATQFPHLSIASGAVTVTAPDELQVELKLLVRDHASVLQVPVHWRHNDDSLQADSTFTLQQSALGLTPFSIAMGALRTADEIEVRCQIAARRVRATSAPH